MRYLRAIRLHERNADQTSHRRANDVLIGAIGSGTNWDGALKDVSTIVHLAARTHVTRETTSDLAATYREVNVEGTRRLARAAVEAGVGSMIFVSSIKVNGERTAIQPFREEDQPRPEDAYGRTKLEAEQVLWGIAQQSGLRVSVLRPPLIYGPGVKGNFLVLLRAIDSGVPLPLASVKNRRSLLYVDNLVSAIMACLSNPLSAGKTYLISDGLPVSTPELVRSIACALARPVRLFPFPPALLGFAGSLLGKRDQVRRLTGSLEVDSSLIRRELGWRPTRTFEQGIAETAHWYRTGFQP
jgi:nucleoside-diphosphate-sugar epimerase